MKFKQLCLVLVLILSTTLLSAKEYRVVVSNPFYYNLVEKIAKDTITIQELPVPKTIEKILEIAPADIYFDSNVGERELLTEENIKASEAQQTIREALMSKNSDLLIV